jgi:hypothetical protein
MERQAITSGTRPTRRRFGTLRLAALGSVLALSAGCSIGDLVDSLDSKYYHISGGNGVYLTIKRHASGCMIYSWFNCVAGGKSQETCARDTLRVAKDIVTRSVPAGRPRDLWNGDYSIFGYHPRFKNAFEDAEAGDFLQAIRDLGSRTDECLRVHWKPTGENWTTLDDEGFAECSWGERVKIPGTSLSCSSDGLR